MRLGSVKKIVINIIFSLIVMASALFVRTPSAYLVNLSDEEKDIYTDEASLPYFTDMDSYYHVRLVDTKRSTGMIGDIYTPEGEPWDMHSYYPEGRSAVYQPGIVYLTVAVSDILSMSEGDDILRVEFALSAFMAAVTALFAYIAGYRAGGKVCGFVAGILTGCAPAFVSRTGFGRFDTDMFVVMMNVLLILFMAEILRSQKARIQYIFTAGFVCTAMIYAFCWAPRYSMLFAGLTVIGGMVYTVIWTLFADGTGKSGERIRSLICSRHFLLPAGAGIVILLLIGITLGFSVVADIFSSLSFKTAADVKEGSLPNLFVSIAELKRAALFPETFAGWFKGYIKESDQSVITGTGGIFVAVFVLVGLLLCALRSFDRIRVDNGELLDKKVCLIYLIIPGLWLLAGLILTRSGVRFIEMIPPSAGLLAGISSGWLTRYARSFSGKKCIAFTIASVIAVLAMLYPAVTGSILVSAAATPSATDASAKAMNWIKENAEDPEAVIESWWDMGYFYESESGHPCLWDGGSQRGARAILFSRAMTDSNMARSNAILKMLAASGDAAVNLMMEHTDPKTAFDTLWDVMLLDTTDACRIIADNCGMTADDAKKAEALIHPAKQKESYLVITYTMTKMIGWFEYYSDWDFTGTQPLPDATWFSYMPDGTPLFMTDEGQQYLEETRSGETMWRLFFNAEENPFFIPEYEWHDGVEHVRIWKVVTDYPQ